MLGELRILGLGPLREYQIPSAIDSKSEPELKQLDGTHDEPTPSYDYESGWQQRDLRFSAGSHDVTPPQALEILWEYRTFKASQGPAALFFFTR